jgi:hypothetical protein
MLAEVVLLRKGLGCCVYLRYSVPLDLHCLRLELDPFGWDDVGLLADFNLIEAEVFDHVL